MKNQGQKSYRQNDFFIPRLALALVLLVIGCYIVYTLYRDYGHIEQRERLAAQVNVSSDMSALHADWRRDAYGKGVLFGVLALSMVPALYYYQRRQRTFQTISAGVVGELFQAKEAAVRANVDKSRFLATVAHEFRTPLSILTSSTDILDRYGERLNREERTQQHDRIRNAARRMSDLVDSVLSYNRFAAQSPLNDPVVVDVGNFCRNLAEEVKTVCCDRHDFSVTIADDCGTILLDETLFRRVAENLLTNAFRYTPADGSVSLHVNRESNLLRVVVADSGIGIPKEDQKRVFEAFFRCRNVEARHGLGLGLSIVHDALLHMGGIVTVDSTVGKGTTIRVDIPIVEHPDTSPDKQDKCNNEVIFCRENAENSFKLTKEQPSCTQS